MSNPDINLFRDEEFEEVRLTPEKVVCLGMEFESDDARRAYFREELRKKLPELRQIEGFPIGEDEDIINLSDPPYYTACPNPWLNDFIAEWEKEKVELEKQGKRSAEFEVNEPYASDVSEGKNNPVYTAHTYHTKVPHPAIMRYILHYTQPGDIIFDGFAGTGMTGVAAAACIDDADDIAQRINAEWIANYKCKPNWGVRHAICGDLSPYASLLSYNYNTPVNIHLLKEEATRILEELKEECGWMYKTLHEGKNIGSINCAIWSDLFICNNCGNDFIYWNAALDKNKKCILDEIECPHCKAKYNKKALTISTDSYFDEKLNKTSIQTKSLPVYIAYTANGRRFEKEAELFDQELIERIKNIQTTISFPSSRLPEGGETRRNDKNGITHIHHFFTKRNLIVLSLFMDKIEKSQLPNKLKFLFTGMINRASKMNRMHVNHFFNGGGGWNGGNLKGTLYVPNLPVETSVLEQIEDRINAYIRAFNYLPKQYTNALFTGSAECIPLNTNSVDYIFVDPPFGANISYSELNIIPESWLKVSTNNEHEAIVNTHQNKNAYFYFQMMNYCFKEFYRILKPGKWITIEFSNTSASIWNSIQTAISNVGFIVSNISALDKKQGSFNAVTTTTAVKQDLVITCYKPTDELINKFEQSTDKSVNAMDFIEELLYHLPVHLEKNNSTTAVIERSPKILYDRLISYYVQHGYAIPMDAQEFQKALRERFIERDGMFFTASQTVEYEAKKEKTDGVVPMALFISSEAEGIEWLKRELAEPQTYQEILPNWMKDMVAPKKGDVLPELAVILEENFIKDEDGKWRKPDAEKAADLEILRGKKLMKEFNLYLEQASKPKAKRMKDTRLEVLRYGFKECYKQKNYQAIVIVGDHIQESLLQEDEVLLQYYDIASMRV